MFHSLLMFLAPEMPLHAQATLTSPPANAQSVRHAAEGRKASFRFMASIALNAIGFGALLAGCWLFLQLMQVLLLP